MEPTQPSQSPVRLPSDNRPTYAIEARSAAAPAAPTASSQFDLGEVYYILFRHKWKLISCTLLGLSAALAFFFLSKPLFQSEAKLFVRYVVTEGKTVPTGPDDGVRKSPDMRGETIIASEQQILTSFDVAVRTAERVGPEKLLGDAPGGDASAAASVIRKGLTVDAPKFSSVIQVSFQHGDSTLVQPVLRELVEQYLKMHVEVHRAAGMVGDFLAQETDQLRSRLIQTEDELRKANQKAGVISIDEAKQGISKQLGNIREAILETEATLAEQSAIVDALRKKLSTPEETPAGQARPQSTEIPREKVEEYRRTISFLENLKNREQEMLLRYTPDNSFVKDVRSQIETAEAARRKLDAEYPALAAPVTVGPSAQASAPKWPVLPDISTEIAKVIALQAKVKALNAQSEALRREATNLDEMEGRIAELRRKKQIEESNYLRYAASLENSRINEALGSGKVSNISVIQAPSIPIAASGKTMKTALGIGFGLTAVGIAWALAVEFLFDRSVRRPVHIERLRVPLLISLPAVRAPKTKRSRRSAKAKGAEEVPSIESGLPNSGALHVFHETLRDRLIGYFERRNLTHKPKLIAISGLGAGAGATTVAAGLAASLSQTLDGNVLLVDMTTTQGATQQFVKGQAVCGLDEMLGTPNSAQVNDNLYVVNESKHTESLSRNLPHRFAKLVPQLKASDFDYIIFDMPPVSEISVTPRLASFMDIVLLVIESEQSDQNLAQRAVTLLAESRCQVAAILNKNRNYVPAWLQADALHQAS